MINSHFMIADKVWLGVGSETKLLARPGQGYAQLRPEPREAALSPPSSETLANFPPPPASETSELSLI